ncbi:MAG: AAA family ATPase [Armatimonadota bacterium]
MKLICIYGPPAAGKLTVARELSAITGIKVFHNHLTIDLAEEFFAWGTPAFNTVVDKTRFLFFEEAAKSGTDMIFTFVYAAPMDNLYVERILETVESNGGEVCFVHLQCTPEVVKERVILPDRKRFNKISSVESLERMMSRYDVFSPAPYESLHIDTCVMTPQEAARSIAEHFGLQVLSEK